MLYKDLQSRWAKFRGKEDPNAPIGLKHDKRLEHGDEFWALRNVDLEVKEGEILGIIGRNGAGKSTLLKILSQITAPTEGKIKVKGRIASLLEVGTGFHPELTGRENVYLNGAILGMTRREVRSKFDEIVAFAEIDEFIDTPVKRYSSGMYVRLAFAVAAHLDPEILIVDEVLAVGDAAFQKKCIGKMSSVSRTGKTILFVSHQMHSIKTLCTSVLCMEGGRGAYIGRPEEAVQYYLVGKLSNEDSVSLDDTVQRTGTGEVTIETISCVNQTGERSFRLQTAKNYTFEAVVKNNTNESFSNLSMSIDLHDDTGQRVMMFRTDMIDNPISLPPGRTKVMFKTKRLPIAFGKYRLGLYLGKDGYGTLDYIEHAANVTVMQGDFFGTGHPGHPIHCKNLIDFYIETECVDK